MSKDLVISPSGGSVVVPDGSQGQGTGMSMPGRSALARLRQANTGREGDGGGLETLSDAEHFEKFEHVLSGMFSAGDQELVAKIVSVAQSLDVALARGSVDMELPAIVDNFLQRLTKAGISDVRVIARAVAAGVAYISATEKAAGQLGGAADRDEADRAKVIAALKEKWGANFAAKLRAVKEFVNTSLPLSLKEALLQGRDDEGCAVLNRVPVLECLEQLAVGGKGGGGGGSSDELCRELREIQMLMKADPRKYYRDERKQARYRELLDLIGGRA